MAWQGSCSGAMSQHFPRVLPSIIFDFYSPPMPPKVRFVFVVLSCASTLLSARPMHKLFSPTPSRTREGPPAP